MTDHLHRSIVSGKGSSQNMSQGMAKAHDLTTADIANSPNRQPDLALDIQALQILDSSDDCIKVLDLEGRILFMSRGGQVLLGIDDIAPFLNTSWIEFWQGADQQAAREAIAKAKAGEVCTFQGYCPTPSGNPKWWDVKISPIRGTEEQVERLLCISRDITERRQIEDERKQAEERLRESEERYRAIINQAVTGVVCTDLDGNLTLVNQTYCDITGYSADELSQRRMQDITHPEDLPRNAELFQRMRTNGTPFEIEKRYIRKDGSIVWVNSSVSVIRDRDGNPQSAVAIVLDITERKQATLNAEFLATVTQNLAEAVHVEDIIQTIGKQLNQYLQISICAFVEINDSKEIAAIHHSWHQQDAPSLVGVYQLAEFVTDEFLQTAKAGRTLIIRDVKTDPRIADPERFARLKIGSFINVPLIRNNEWKFTLNIYHQTPYNWRSDEIELMRELANRIWTKLERAQAEAALRESEAKYRSLFQSIDEGYAVVEVLSDESGEWNDFLFLDINSAFEQQTGMVNSVGRKATEILGTPNPAWAKIYGQVAQTGEPVRFEQQEATLDRIFDLYAFRLGAAGSRRVAVLFTDITEHKRREAHVAFLAEISEDFSRLLTANEIMQTVGAKIGAYLQITTCNFTDVDEAHDRVTVHDGWSSPAVPSTVGTFRISQYFSQEFLQTSRAGGTVVIRNTQTDPRTDAAGYAALDMYSFVTVPFHRQGRWTHYIAICHSQPRDWREDEIQLIEEISNRIFPRLERARTEEALRESEAKYRGLFESIDAGFCLIEVLFDETGKAFDHRFLEANPAFEKHTGLVNVVGKTVRELVPQTEAYWFEIYGRIALTGVPERFENAAQAMGRFFEVYAFRMGEPHEHKVAILFNDINDRKQAEMERELLLQREQAARKEAESANRIKDEFLAVLSHELRSPLNPILGWSKLLQSKKLDETKTAQALATIERNAKLQSELIEDLLDVSRILRGKLSLNVAPVNLAATIRAAMETVRLAAEAKSITVEVILAPDVGLVLGDSTRLQQVVWNLVSNAVKFTPEGGRVIVQLEAVGSSVLGDGEDRRDGEDREDRGDRISSSPSLPSPYTQITVSDTGQGITPDFLPYVFDYFRQADGATTRKFGGLGLGLAIVRHLIELHGGTVRADSLGEGQGATFTVRLPLLHTSLQAHQNERSSQQSLDLSDIKILVVDDESDTRDLVVFVLEQQGAQVTAASSAHEALLVLPQAKPDVLLSDIGMPEMDGYMLIQQVRALTPDQGGQIPAIALTAYAGDINQQQVLAAGFQKHISKPIEPEVLVQTIVHLIHPN